jgi:hypothetical protein
MQSAAAGSCVFFLGIWQKRGLVRSSFSRNSQQGENLFQKKRAIAICVELCGAKVLQPATIALLRLKVVIFTPLGVNQRQVTQR